MVLINGIETHSVPATDRALHYGDGLFETVAIAGGVPRRWERHLTRLADGCARLGIPQPDAALLHAEALRVCRGAERAVLKVIVTRGSGGGGCRPPAAPTPTRILALHAWPDYPACYASEGVRVRRCSTPLGCNPRLAGVKHLNRLEQVLARAEWSDADVPEGLMSDLHGHVIEGTMSNLFLVRDGTVVTPDLSECGVAGIVRGLVLERCAALGIATAVAQVGTRDLEAAEELFLTNSLIGIWPVRELDGRAYRPGPVSLRLARALASGEDSGAAA
jgi:4-amino-4-deoxychorismate lyase